MGRHRRPGRFYADGDHGRLLYVDRAADVVVVRLGRRSGLDDWSAALRDVADRAGRSPAS